MSGKQIPALDAAADGLSDAALESPTAFVREAFGRDFFANAPEVYCGRRVYIPNTPLADSVICQIMTLDQARRLAAVHGGAYLDVQRDSPARLRRAILEQSKDKVPADQIAVALKCSRSHVFRIRAELRAEGKL